MNKHKIACGPVHDQGWGLLTQVTLPGGGKLGIYQPRHARPKPMAARKPAKKSAKRTTNKPARKLSSKMPNKKTRGR